MTDDERRALDAAALRTGRSLSSLIRDAVEQVYGSERSTADDLTAMRRALPLARGGGCVPWAWCNSRAGPHTTGYAEDRHSYSNLDDVRLCFD
ncbi:MAG: hypothetical protein M1435_02575 [Actinobacteria bacterium]|nr:hypothetical protein [Actinomycetota bacterium]